MRVFLLMEEVVMNGSICKLPSVFAKPIFVGALICGASVAWAQGGGANLVQQLSGTSWSLVAQYVVQPDGKRVEAFGAAPKGFLVYDQNGRFVAVMMRPDLPKFASSNRMTGTADENKAIVQGSTAYYGKWSVNEKGLVVSHLDGATYPNWDGQDQVREVSFAGDQMTTCIPGAAQIGGGTACAVWKRAK